MIVAIICWVSIMCQPLSLKCYLCFHWIFTTYLTRHPLLAFTIREQVSSKVTCPASHIWKIAELILKPRSVWFQNQRKYNVEFNNKQLSSYKAHNKMYTFLLLGLWATTLPGQVFIFGHKSWCPPHSLPSDLISKVVWSYRNNWPCRQRTWMRFVA